MDNKLILIKNFLEQKYNYKLTTQHSMVFELKNELELDVVEFVGLIKTNYSEDISNLSKDEIKFWGISKKDIILNKYYVSISYIEIDKLSNDNVLPFLELKCT